MYRIEDFSLVVVTSQAVSGHTTCLAQSIAFTDYKWE